MTILAVATAALLAAPQSPPIDPDGLPGTRILAGGGRLPAAIVDHFLHAAGGPGNARVVLIPTASATADTAEGRDRTLQRWRDDHPGVEFALLHTRDRTEADREEFIAPLRTATGVWLGGGAQKNLADAYLGTRVERELQALLARGGVVAGTSAGTAIQTRTMIQEGRDPPIVAHGFDFVPFAVSDQHFLARNRLPRLLQVLAARPGHFGVGIDEGTAVSITGRTMTVLGASKALLVLAAAAGREQRIVELGAGDTADLVTWQRAARDRAAGPAPAAAPMATGTLVLCGGGPIPRAAAERFVALAGGAAARIVLVPSAAPADGRGPDPFAALLRELGAADVRELDCSHPRDVTTGRLAALQDATGVWFGGGRQWRLVDAFDGTPAIAAFRAVLARGGVVGGTSAGASILASFLVRGNPLGNAEMWCEGYDRGFGLLPDSAIDQHFSQRQRLPDLEALIARRPDLLGLGIDEGTAAIVDATGLAVLGDGKVAVVRSADARPATTWIAAGSSLRPLRGGHR